MSDLTTDEGNDQIECVLQKLMNDIVIKKQVSRNWLSRKNVFKDTMAMVRLNQALSRDPDAFHALFDMFMTAVHSKSMDKPDSIKAELLSVVDRVQSFDELRAMVDANTGDIVAPELIEHLLSKIDDGVDGGDGGDGDDCCDGGLNFRTVPFPSFVVAASGPRLPLQNTFTFAMGPRCDGDDGGLQGEELLIYVPVTSTTGAYGALDWRPMPPEVESSVNLNVALVMARWIDSWGDTSLFGAGRYRAVLVCHARRSTLDCRLPYQIGPPRYLVVCAEQTRAKTAQCLEKLRVHHKDNNVCSVQLKLPWQKLVLGALVLVGGYIMANRYGVSVVWEPTNHWRSYALRLCRPTVLF